jgi:glycosyltransferase involved in cell wall biosynthesis
MDPTVRKIRIAYLIDTIDSDKGGTEKQLFNIIQRLNRNLFEVTFVCLYESPWMTRNPLPCEVVALGYRGFLKPSFPLVFLRYLRLLSDRRFDLVQTFFEDSMFIGYLGKLLSSNRHALVISRRDLGLGCDEPVYHWLYKKIKPFILRSVDGVAVNAHAIKEHIIKHENITPDKITVIGNGLDIPMPSMETPSLFRDYRADLWIGIVANLKPVKRIDLLLHALAKLKNDDQKVIRTVVLGDDRLKVELKYLAETLGIADRVHFVGSVANVSDYLHNIDIGVLCSDKEGLSNAILEYMACGLPVVATAVGGNVEMVDETNGICIPAGDAAALANAIFMMAESRKLREKLGAESKEKVLKTYTWDKIMSQWERYYLSLSENITS